MPHSLTERQTEYLEYLKDYMSINEHSPTLKEIAEHFKVRPPTVHKTLRALELKGFLMSRRDSVSGFFIRLAERGGGIEKIINLMIIGKVDKDGFLNEFPGKHGNIEVCLFGVDEMEVFGIQMSEDLPQASLRAGDILICDYGKRPQATDIAVLPFGIKAKKFWLCQIFSQTMDKDMPNLEVANPFPIPEELIDLNLGKKLTWEPLARDKENEKYFEKLEIKEDTFREALPPELVGATVIKIIRKLKAN
jgi:DNA-binding MarR family transcriptional regulator